MNQSSEGKLNIHDARVLQFKSGLLLAQADAEEILMRMAVAVELARNEVLV